MQALVIGLLLFIDCALPMIFMIMGIAVKENLPLSRSDFYSYKSKTNSFNLSYLILKSKKYKSAGKISFS